MSWIALQGALPIFEQPTLLFLQFGQMRENSALVLRHEPLASPAQRFLLPRAAEEKTTPVGLKLKMEQRKFDSMCRKLTTGK